MDFNDIWFEKPHRYVWDAFYWSIVCTLYANFDEHIIMYVYYSFKHNVIQYNSLVLIYVILQGFRSIN